MPKLKNLLLLLLIASLTFLPAVALAQSALEISAVPGSGGKTVYSVGIQTLLVFAALSFLPAVLLLMTSFTRIVIVLSLMRQALGLQSTPPNQVIVGMSLFLTFFVMAPTFETVYEQAWVPYEAGTLPFDQAVNVASDALRSFMMAQTRAADVTLFSSMAQLPVENVATTDEIPLRVLVPAFVVSELKTAFQIGFLVFIPFLIIDLVVASVLMSMGMMMLSPVLVALPFKLMLFVLADGWHLLVGSMVASFNVVGGS